jgi:hypothetical protein
MKSTWVPSSCIIWLPRILATFIILDDVSYSQGYSEWYIRKSRLSKSHVIKEDRTLCITQGHFQVLIFFANIFVLKSIQMKNITEYELGFTLKFHTRNQVTLIRWDFDNFHRHAYNRHSSQTVRSIQLLSLHRFPRMLTIAKTSFPLFIPWRYSVTILNQVLFSKSDNSIKWIGAFHISKTK